MDLEENSKDLKLESSDIKQSEAIVSADVSEEYENEFAELASSKDFGVQSTVKEKIQVNAPQKQRAKPNRRKRR
jgi:hypothetical protein